MNVVAAMEVYPGWYHIEWLYPGLYKFAAVRQVKKIEKQISSSHGKGWLMESDRTHTQMHPIIEKLGGKRYAEDDKHIFFVKEIPLCAEAK